VVIVSRKTGTRFRSIDPTKGTLGEMLDAEERIAAKIQGETDWS